MESLGLIAPQFWRGRRVFLTGHTGFKGSWLSLWLTQLGAKVTGFALAPPTEPNLFDDAAVAREMSSLTGDIRDAEAIRNAIRTANPELIIHMAAQSLVRRSYADPLGTYATNVMGTAHVLDAVRNCPSVRGVLIVTSDKCYENQGATKACSEDDAMGGYDPYSSSKGCAELITSAWRRSYFHPENYTEHRVAIASARAGNVIGGGDWAEDRLIPDAMRAFLAHKTLEIRNPKAVRPWQHVLDPLAGYLQLCQQLLGPRAANFAEAWNFGPDEESEQSVEAVLGILQKKLGEGASWRVTGAPADLHEATYLRLNCRKAREILKWQPRYTLDQALAMTASWYRVYEGKKDLRTETLRQIDHLMNGTSATAARLAHG